MFVLHIFYSLLVLYFNLYLFFPPRFYILSTSYGFVFLCQTLLNMIISKFIHVTANGIVSFFFMAQHYSIVYMHHIFFIHSSVNGHLGFFHILAIVDSAIMNTGLQVYFGLLNSSYICPGVRLLDYMVVLYLFF